MKYFKLWTKQFVILGGLIKSHKRILITIVIMFVLGIYAGLRATGELKTNIFLSVAENFSKLETEKPLFIDIFLNNLRVASISLALGLLVIAPPVVIFLTGFTLGITLDFIYRIFTITDNPSGYASFLSLIPHGALEFPVIILSSFLAFCGGLKLIFDREFDSHEGRRQFLSKIIRSFVFVLVPMLLFAAIIETYISPIILNSTLSSIKEVEVNKEVQSLIVSEEDLGKIGVNAKESEAADLSSEETWLFLKLIGAYVFDEEIYRNLKSTKAEGFAKKYYSVEPNRYLQFTIEKMSAKKVEDRFKLLNKIVFAYQKIDQKAVVAEIEPSIYVVNLEGKNVFVFVGTEGEYVYMMSYNGPDFKEFLRIIDIQGKKLSSSR